MIFVPILRAIVEACGGGIGAALMGNDGIPIEEFALETPELDFDVATAGVEFGRILEDVRKASDAMAGGPVGEITIQTGRFSLIFSTVDEDLFLVLAIAPDGNLGKARYLIRRHMLAIRQEL
jgi:predicted regulator of Ras-like GTPase activity (Roadblock/LC7/MglB family)